MARTPRTVWIQAIRKCNGLCWFCGQEAKTIDHAVPRSRGGTNHISNLLPACNWCNNLKGNMSVSQFRKFLRHAIALKLLMNGSAGIPNLNKKVCVVFFGEGNDSPFHFQRFCTSL